MNTPFSYISRLFVAVILMLLPTLIIAQTVDAVDDIAHTTKNNSVVIAPLNNDNGAGNLRLDKVVLQNHGTAVIQGKQILFTPDANFKGAALINYTMCDSRNQCATGLVIVDIADNVIPTYQEMKIFVVEDATTKFTLPIGFKRKDLPTNGSVEPTSAKGEWLYRPKVNFKGYDRSLFETIDTDGTIKGFEVQFEVLRKPNQYVTNDLISTRIGQPIKFNVLNNDSSQYISDIRFGACTGGSIVANTDGVVTFTPSLPQGGKATFSYTVVANGKTETANVSIFVSNYLPSKDQFRLTCSGVPLVMHYPSPITGFKFEVLDENTNVRGAKVKYFASIDTIIETHRIKGKNVLVYIPNINQGDDNDAFSVRYCIDNTCTDWFDVYVDIKEPGLTGDQCATDCVWPGDANLDGVVNILDLYPIAQNMGQYGLKRGQEVESSKNAWYPHRGDNWGKTTFGVDMKHTDANGDGIVSADDVEAIVENYGNNTTITPIKTVEESAIEIQLVPSATSFRPGDMIELTVSMGSSELPAYDAKGLSFNLDYDAKMIKENTLTTDFSAFTWLSRYDAYLSLSTIVERGKLEAGLVRSKGKGANGHGEVGKVRAVVEDNLVGFRGNDKATLKFHFNNAMLMGANGQPVQLQTKDLEVPLILGKKTDVLKSEDLIMYPNPASDMVNFYINGVNNIEYVRIMDAAGREVVRMNNVEAKSASVQVSNLQGFYIAEIMTEKGRIVKKLEIFK